MVDCTETLMNGKSNERRRTSVSSKGKMAIPSARNLDARDLLPPFTPGALRGGTHVHQFSPDGMIVSST
jgi:hypothetical protein